MRTGSWKLTVLALTLAPGCVSTPPLFDFSGDETFFVRSSSILHEVTLFFEMDRAPNENEEPMLGRLRERGERYTAGYADDPLEKHHRFSYEGGQLLVGEVRYPAQRGAMFFIFQERQEALTFSFRGRRIRIERPETWTPAVMYREVQETTELTPQAPATPSRRKTGTVRRTTVSRILREEFQAGPHRFILPFGSNTFEVNGVKVDAPPGSSIVVDRRGGVRVSR